MLIRLATTILVLLTSLGLAEAQQAKPRKTTSDDGRMIVYEYPPGSDGYINQALLEIVCDPCEINYWASAIIKVTKDDDDHDYYVLVPLNKGYNLEDMFILDDGQFLVFVDSGGPIELYQFDKLEDR
jgi:hypothetical protein